MENRPPPSADRAATLLVVEDDPFQVGFYEQVLTRPELTLRFAGTLAEADASMKERPPTAVVLDLMLPDGDGRSWLAGLRERPGTATLPVIVVAGTGGLDAQVDCYALGAHLLTKPIDPRLLLAAVAGAVERAHRHQSERLVDEETGLLNRAGLLDALARAGDAGPGPIALALLEPDGRPDREALPAALRSLASLAVEEADARPPGARWSGSVVAVLLTGATAAEAGARLERARLRARSAGSGTGGDPFSAGVADAGVGTSPAEAAAAAERALTEARLEGGDRIAWPGVGPRASRGILVAEDDDVVGALLEHRLERDGFRVERARDGLEALEIASTRSISLAILDVLMPGLDGFELLARLRRMPEHAHTPVVMLSGLTGERDIERAFAAGAQDYVLKPFSPIELAARLNRLLRRA